MSKSFYINTGTFFLNKSNCIISKTRLKYKIPYMKIYPPYFF